MIERTHLSEVMIDQLERKGDKRVAQEREEMPVEQSKALFVLAVDLFEGRTYLVLLVMSSGVAGRGRIPLFGGIGSCLLYTSPSPRD